MTNTAGLTSASVPAVVTLRQVSRSASAPAAAAVPQQEAFSAPPFLTVCSYKETVDYLTASSNGAVTKCGILAVQHLLPFNFLSESKKSGSEHLIFFEGRLSKSSTALDSTI